MVEYEKSIINVKCCANCVYADDAHQCSENGITVSPWNYCKKWVLNKSLAIVITVMEMPDNAE